MSKAIHALLAVIMHSFREMAHNRALYWLPVLIAGIAVFLPFSLRGDGSPESVIRLILTYPPALATAILLAGSALSGAALMRSDPKGGRAMMFRIAPIHPILEWTGKWLAILLLNALLLAVAGVGLTMSLAWATDGMSPRETARLLDGWRAYRPDDQRYRDEAQARLTAMDMAGVARSQRPDGNRMRVHVRTEAFRVEPGHSVSWDIRMDGAMPSADGILQFQWRCDPLSRAPVSGTWTLASGHDDPIRIPVVGLLDGWHSLRLPAGFAQAAGTVTVAFSNEPGSTLTFFDPLDPVTLRRWTIPFAANGFRAGIILFAFSASAAALGLTLGALFSLPVAAFTAFSFGFAITLAFVFAGLPPIEPSLPDAGLFSTAGTHLLDGIHRYSASTVRLLPLHTLANALEIPSSVVWRALWRLLAVIPLMLAIPGARILNRKECP